MTALAQRLADMQVAICVGSGGVGKTTVAASLALDAALSGRRVVVLTIDPAHRLANALGLERIDARPQPIDLSAVDDSHAGTPGRLEAMRLAQKTAWDELIDRHAPNAGVRDRVLRNAFYRHLSASFAGSYEYVAVERVCALVESGRYDLVVVDTPPTRHAIDFFEAPDRITRFLDSRIVRWFLLPYRSPGWEAARRLGGPARYVLGRLEAATGASTLTEIADFFAATAVMFEAFAARAETMRAILGTPTTACLLVTSPDSRALDEARRLMGELRRLDVRPLACIFNRVHPATDEASIKRGESVAHEDLTKALVEAGLEPALAVWLARNDADYARLARHEAAAIARFSTELGTDTSTAVIPVFETDLHDLRGLRQLAGALGEPIYRGGGTS